MSYFHLSSALISNKNKEVEEIREAADNKDVKVTNTEVESRPKRPKSRTEANRKSGKKGEE